MLALLSAGGTAATEDKLVHFSCARSGFLFRGRPVHAHHHGVIALIGLQGDLLLGLQYLLLQLLHLQSTAPNSCIWQPWGLTQGDAVQCM